MPVSLHTHSWYSLLAENALGLHVLVDDLDFDWKVRDEVIAHVLRRHGERHAAMISSHLFLQPRSAFREAAKAHGLSNEQVSRLLEELPERVERLLASGGRKPPGPAPDDLQDQGAYAPRSPCSC